MTEPLLPPEPTAINSMHPDYLRLLMLCSMIHGVKVEATYRMKIEQEIVKLIHLLGGTRATAEAAVSD